MVSNHDEGQLDFEDSNNRSYQGEDYTDASLSGREYNGCTFRGCNFSQTDLSASAFDGCRFIECNLSNPVIKNARFLDCAFDGCKLLGLNFCYCKQLSFDLIVKNSRLLNCNFSGLKMKKSAFTDSILEECYFEDTFLVEVDFSRTAFRSTLFHHCDLQKADFTDADGYAVNPLNNKLQKAVFNLPGALSLLGYFNIILK